MQIWGMSHELGALQESQHEVKETVASLRTEVRQGFAMGSDRPNPPESLIIDLDQRTVTVSFRVFSITTVTENYLRFEGVSGGDRFEGSLDRVSGSGFVRWYRGSQWALTG